MSNGSHPDYPALDPEILAEFRAFVEESAAELVRRSSELAAGDMSAVARIFEQGHNLKGIGSTFGFDLLSNASGSLCGYIKRAGQSAGFRPAVVTAHVEAIVRIIDAPLVGNGGAEGHSLMARLEALAAV